VTDVKSWKERFFSRATLGGFIKTLNSLDKKNDIYKYNNICTSWLTWIPSVKNGAAIIFNELPLGPPKKRVEKVINRNKFKNNSVDKKPMKIYDNSKYKLHIQKNIL